MKGGVDMKTTAIGLCALLFTTQALAGTIGIFRIADDKIIAVSDDGTKVVLDSEAFREINSKAEVGDELILDGGRWQVMEKKTDLKSLKVKPSVHDLQQVDLVSE
jgi:hypothetical protein